MKTLIIFLLGLIIGGVATLFLPNTRRDEFNAEIRTQTGALQAHLQQFGDQIKGAKQPRDFPICSQRWPPAGLE
jgi:gas vesicle protein